MSWIVLAKNVAPSCQFLQGKGLVTSCLIPLQSLKVLHGSHHGSAMVLQLQLVISELLSQWPDDIPWKGLVLESLAGYRGASARGTSHTSLAVLVCKAGVVGLPGRDRSSGRCGFRSTSSRIQEARRWLELATSLR